MHTYLHGIVLLDVGVGVADSPAVVGHNIRNFVFADHLSLDLAKFEGSLLGVDADRLEASLDVVKHAEVLTSLGNGDDVHDTERVPGVAADLSVDLEVSLLVSADLDSLLAGESVLQSVAEQDGHGDAVSQLVGAGGRAGRVHSLKFVQAPFGWSPHALHMLFRSSCL